MNVRDFVTGLLPTFADIREESGDDFFDEAFMDIMRQELEFIAPDMPPAKQESFLAEAAQHVAQAHGVTLA